MSFGPWYDRAFGPWYERLYAHRGMDEARTIWAGLEMYLPRRGLLLDIGCGSGRHLRVLEERGHAVFGLDRSWDLLTAAKKNAVSNVVRGDMRRLPFPDAMFAGVVSMFTSFGYFESQREHAELLREWHRVLGAGGRLILDYLNPSYVLDHLETESERTVDDLNLHETRTLGRRGEDRVVQKRVRITREGRVLAEYEERVALYEPPTVLDMGSQAGFKPSALLGDYSGLPWSPQRPRAIYVWDK